MNKNKPDNPGVYIPPPLIYAATFMIAVFLQKKIPVDDSFFKLFVAKVAGIIFLLVSLPLLVTSLRQFIRSRNTLVTIMPAASLQTNGIYYRTRNPMYLGLAAVYLGLGFIIGNWWNFILFPLLLFIVQEYIIKREEKYLYRRFGQEYLNYKLSVRRWI